MMVFVQRLIQLVPTLFGVSVLVFFLMRLAPGDPVRLMLGAEASPEAVEELRRQLGFDKPIIVQYVTYMGLNFFSGKEATLGPAVDDTTGIKQVTLSTADHDFLKNDIVVFSMIDGSEQRRLLQKVSGADISWVDPLEAGSLAQGAPLHVPFKRGVLQGDFGISIARETSVTSEIFARLPATIELAVCAMFFATLVGMLVGVLSAVYPRTLLDSTTRMFVFIFLAMPSFWLGLELIIIFARNLMWFPPSGKGEFGTFSMISHLVLPASTLGLSTGAFLCRILRSSMLQVLNQDFIRTARAKGLDRTSVVIRHALRNAMIPFVTVAGLSLGGLLGGSVIVETVFNWPGVGKLFVDSILQRDLPVTMGCVLILATIFVLINLAVDLLYVVLDPRIRLEGTQGS